MLAAQGICYKCETGGVCVATSSPPSHVHCQTCGPPPYSCCVQDQCQPDGPSAINAAGTISPSLAFNLPGSQVSQKAVKFSSPVSSVARRIFPGTAWQTNCRGGVIARAMPTGLGVQLRKQLREIRV